MDEISTNQRIVFILGQKGRTSCWLIAMAQGPLLKFFIWKCCKSRVHNKLKGLSGVNGIQNIHCISFLAVFK